MINEHEFRVNDGEKNFVVDLDKKTCICREFDLDQMPCAHALAVIRKRKMSSYPFCSNFYTPEALESTYAVTDYPVGNICQWEWEIPEEVENRKVLPPITQQRSGGRPKRKSIPLVGEEQVMKKCGRCGERGDNRKTCKNDIHVNDHSKISLHS